MIANLKLAVVLLIVWATCAPLFADAGGVAGYRPAVEKLRVLNELETSWRAVNRWRIEYEATVLSGRNKGTSVRKVMAIGDPADLYQSVVHVPFSNNGDVDPFCQEYFIHDGKTCHQWPFNRSYSEGTILPGDLLAGTTWMDVLLAVVPRWPLTTYKMPVDPRLGTPGILIEAMHSDDLRLLTNSEVVGEENCAIFEVTGVDRIAIATNKGMCLMLRELRDPHSGKLLRRYKTEKIEQIAPNLWFPKKYLSQTFEVSNGNTEIMQQEVEVQIFDVFINTAVAESTFIPIHRPGAIKFDGSNEFTQQIPNGQDLLSDTLDFMHKYMGLPSKPFPRSHFMLFLLSGLACGLMAGLVMSRWRLKNFKKAKGFQAEVCDAKA
jgi:hypothetical protein